MTPLAEITATDFSVSIAEPGEVVTNINDIRQCLWCILMTEKESSPYEPFFGCDWFKRIDQPASQAVPQMIQDVRYAISRWEPRVIVQDIRPDYSEVHSGIVIIRIYWTVVSGVGAAQPNTMEFRVGQGTIVFVNDFNQYIYTEFGILTI